MFSKLSCKHVLPSVVVTFVRNKLRLHSPGDIFHTGSDRDSNYKDIQVGIQGFSKLTNCPGINDDEAGRQHAPSWKCTREEVGVEP